VADEKKDAIDEQVSVVDSVMPNVDYRDVH
jgi:hypothetical protein